MIQLFSRHKSDLIKLIICLSIGLMSTSTIYGQINRGNYNYLDYKNKDYYFGISLGLNTSQHQVFHSREFIDNTNFLRAQGAPAGGFNVQGIVNYKIGDFFDIRTLPGFTFATRHIDFQSTEDAITALPPRTTIESIFVNIPFLVRFKSAPYRDKRAYIVAGINYSFDVASNSRSRGAEELIQIDPHDFQIEAGIGMQFFFPYFILSPEIKFSQGINNTLLFNNQIEESTIIEKLLSRVLTFSFHFEG